MMIHHLNTIGNLNAGGAVNAGNTFEDTHDKMTSGNPITFTGMPNLNTDLVLNISNPALIAGAPAPAHNVTFIGDDNLAVNITIMSPITTRHITASHGRTLRLVQTLDSDCTVTAFPNANINIAPYAYIAENATFVLHNRASIHFEKKDEDGNDYIAHSYTNNNMETAEFTFETIVGMMGLDDATQPQ